MSRHSNQSFIRVAKLCLLRTKKLAMKRQAFWKESHQKYKNRPLLIQYKPVLSQEETMLMCFSLFHSHSIYPHFWQEYQTSIHFSIFLRSIIIGK